ncbi:hypothetical protein HU200_059720 [Digitaria exilis]|uniref:Uncharacterized protein n=1 Tax=Digitaria exilis TaxID=1010633 RepID=A0A835AFX0_9POAL|nr:hypothetical protein HU200_059720 [Digitaria exilis]
MRLSRRRVDQVRASPIFDAERELAAVNGRSRCQQEEATPACTPCPFSSAHGTNDDPINPTSITCQIATTTISRLYLLCCVTHTDAPLTVVAAIRTFVRYDGGSIPSNPTKHKIPQKLRAPAADGDASRIHVDLPRGPTLLVSSAAPAPWLLSSAEPARAGKPSRSDSDHLPY